VWGSDGTGLLDAALEELNEPVGTLGGLVRNEVLAQRSWKVEADAVSVHFALLLERAVVHLSADQARTEDIVCIDFAFARQKAERFLSVCCTDSGGLLIQQHELPYFKGLQSM
jgi:hypothetical protein